MADATSFVYGLAVVNVVVYAVLLYQLIHRVRAGRVAAGSLSEAFALLGEGQRAAVPGIPPGFTWREGMVEARKLNHDVNWGEVMVELEGYEAHKYGGATGATVGYGEVLTLARELRRR